MLVVLILYYNIINKCLRQNFIKFLKNYNFQFINSN